MYLPLLICGLIIYASFIYFNHSCFVTHTQFLLVYISFSTGTESPQAVRKLMSLSEKVRPHNPKQHHLPGHHTLNMPGTSHSPGGTRRPLSPRHNRAPGAVHLSTESSSLVNLGTMTLRKSTTASKITLLISTSVSFVQ